MTINSLYHSLHHLSHLDLGHVYPLVTGQVFTIVSLTDWGLLTVSLATVSAGVAWYCELVLGNVSNPTE